MGTIKNLRSATKDKLPTAEQLQTGQIAINFNSESPFLAIKLSDGNIFKFNPLMEWVGSQAEFDLIEYRNPNVTYYITD